MKFCFLVCARASATFISLFVCFLDNVSMEGGRNCGVVLCVCVWRDQVRGERRGEVRVRGAVRVR